MSGHDEHETTTRLSGSSDVDRDGAIAEALDRPTVADTRRGFLRKSALALGAVVGGGAALAAVAAPPALRPRATWRSSTTR